MNKNLQEKYQKLKDFFAELEEVVIAYSGGIDSSLLLKVAKDELGDEVIALIGKPDSMPEKELESALLKAKEIGVEPVIVKTPNGESPEYCLNPEKRCPRCKYNIYSSFARFMHKNKLLHLIDGSNNNDKDNITGNEHLIADFETISPLKELGFTKQDVSKLSKELNLSGWIKKLKSCFATPFVKNEPNVKNELSKVELAEEFLYELEFNQVRAQLIKGVLKIQVNPHQVQKFFNEKTRQKVLSRMKELGFKNVSIDMEGYRVGKKNREQFVNE